PAKSNTTSRPILLISQVNPHSSRTTDNAVDIKPDRSLDQLQRALVRTYHRGENQQAGLFLPDPNSESPELSAGIAAERNARSYFLRSLLHYLGL
ncbi:hypothetical protein, partial [Bradyrhizobium sp. 33ap4]|uniref:hypothetical protein n=1 Tax=Bradyrhizobium sp. 33ap4 TaxID=3061630 RepID=UPI00292DC43C